MSLPKHSRKCLNAPIASPCICGLIERELKRFDLPLPIPMKGMAYGFDTDYWKPIRVGSNFEVPSFGLTGFVAHIPLATGKSKKLYEKAVARALYNACEKVLGIGHAAVRYDGNIAIEADDRLYHRIYS